MLSGTYRPSPGFQMHEPYNVSPMSSQEHLSEALFLSGSRRMPPIMSSHPACSPYVTSDSESCHEDNDYTTDLTSPPCSEAGLDDIYNDEIETFRDQEYPQLKGKVYLDHGGTTVSRDSIHSEDCEADIVVSSYMPNL